MSADVDARQPAERRVTGLRAEPVVTAAPAVRRRRNRDRLHALDGLRGVAAVVVVLHHVALVAQPVSAPSGEPPVLSAWWWIERTPLKLLTAGREAVVVFFVLSGLVVALPALKRIDFSWPGLLASRFVRLFLPAWASIAFASLLLLIPRRPEQVTGDSWLARQVPHDWSWETLLKEWSLMIGSVPQNNVLWTLRWELAFSLLLPAFLVLAMLLGRWWLPTGALALGLSTAGMVADIDALGYLPMFFFGTLIAVRLLALERWSEARSAKRLLAVVLGVSLVVLVLEFLLAPVVPQGTQGAHAIRALETLGAVGIVVCAAGATRLRTALERRVPQFLGRISFSLYLVHLPVIATLAFVLGDWNWPVVGLIAIPLSIVAGWGFYRLVEKPLHRLARAAKRGSAHVVERYIRLRHA